MWKPKRLDAGKPLYLAIADALQKDIHTGALASGEAIPPQRDLARALGVNLSTVTRAYAQCQRRGLIRGTVGRGTVVATEGGISMPGVSEADGQGGLIEMGVVLPLYRCEAETEAQIRETLATRTLGKLLRYAEAGGLREHREAGAAWLRRSKLEVEPSSVLVTCGSQNALAASLLALFRPGDRVAVDELTYPGIVTLASLHALRLVPIRMDRWGMIPDELAAACRRFPMRGVYLMPEVQNPTTCSLPEERRSRIVSLVKRHGLVLLEDDAYGFTADAPSAALSLRLPENAVFMAGVSKALGAGLRVSFLTAPRRLAVQIENALLGLSWMASPLCAAVVSDLITSRRADAIVASKRAEARRRSALAAKKLSSYGPRVTSHGFFSWLDLPEGWTGRGFELAAREAGVRVFGAERFCVEADTCRPGARVSLTGPETAQSLSDGLDAILGVLAGGFRRTNAML